MQIKVSLFNSTTNDLAIVIDLLRASTTINVALKNFNRVIPVNSEEKAIIIKEREDAILAGEQDLKVPESFDISNSPKAVQEQSADVLVLKTTNGTRVLESIKMRNNNVKVLIGTAINARAVAEKALELASDEIELIMAGRHEEFTIEDAIGAGLIIKEIMDLAKQDDIDIILEESALATKLLADDTDSAVQLIKDSLSGQRLSSLGYTDDIEICQEINTIDFASIYDDGEITRL
ncbi:2-phosphosulfolactate phosphatase [Methanosphaera sp.]